jgi:ribose transport system permease protein
MSTPTHDDAARVTERPAGNDGPADVVLDDFERRIRAPRVIRLQHIQDYGVIALGVVLFVYFSFTSGNFFTTENLLHIVYQNSIIGIIACVLTLTMISGNFDLSVGSSAILAGVVAAWVGLHWSVWLSLPAAIVVGVALGMGNGLVVARLKVDPFLTTLATALVFGGIALGLTGGFLITPKEGADVFTFLGQSNLFGVAYSTIIFVVVAVLAQLALTFTRFGRRLYAIGGNPIAARLAGVRNAGVVITAFALTGAASGLGGFLQTSFTGIGTAQPSANLALLAVSAVALGGTSIFGGSGAVWRTVVGVLILGMLSNGFDLAGVPTYWQQVVTGALIIGVISIQAMAQRR